MSSSVISLVKERKKRQSSVDPGPLFFPPDAQTKICRLPECDNPVLLRSAYPWKGFCCGEHQRIDAHRSQGERRTRAMRLLRFLEQTPDTLATVERMMDQRGFK